MSVAITLSKHVYLYKCMSPTTLFGLRDSVCEVYPK